ncbi:MAG: type I restriction endonuclease subunit R [Bacilli bacterium]
MFDEEQLENAIIEHLCNMGYKHLYGPDIVRDYREVILKDIFFESLFRINKNITFDIVEETFRKIKDFSNVELILANKEFNKFLYGGVEVPLQGDKTYTVKLLDDENPENNTFMVVNQYTVEEYKTKRPDVIIFINGIPMVVFELKNAMKIDTTIENAYNQLKNYQQDIKSLFYYNAFNVICDGVNARVGTITADFTRYMTWKSKEGEHPEEIFDQVDTLLDGVFGKERFIDLVRNFIVFQNGETKLIKILAGYHQYFAVKKSIECTKKSLAEKSRKAGVVWHTQGSGKSFAMVFYTGILLKDKELDNPTIVVLTDRNDLDEQLFKTFATCNKEILPQTCINAKNRKQLKELLKVNAGGIIFTTIQKFEEGKDVLSKRENIIFIADEAHRSQYGLTAKFNIKTGYFKYGYAKNMRNALPNATFIGFTGTPVNLVDRSTREIFGDYIDVYDMTQAVEDGATVPIYYENRVAKLRLDEDLLKQVDEEYNKIKEDGQATSDVIDKSQKELSRLETIIGSKERLKILANDIIEHYEKREDVLTGKAMIVSMSRKIAINLYKEIISERPSWTQKVRVILTDNNNDPEEWHDLVKNKQYREEMAVEFKKKDSAFKIAIVVDMWLTGFDVPSLNTMYLDKPMKGHTLMQAIARVNRVYKDKEAGLIVDYIGFGNELKEALNQYTNRDKDKVPDLSKAYEILKEKLEIMKDMFYGFNYNGFLEGTAQERLKSLAEGINYVLGFEEAVRNDFVSEATALSQADTLARTLLDEKTKIEVEYFKGIKVGINKITDTGKLTTSEVNARISIIIEQAIQQDGVIDLFEKAQMNKPEIAILSDEYMENIRNMKHKNIAANLLKKLLAGNIKHFKRINVVKSELFSEKLQKIMMMYNNRLIDSVEVIEQLLLLSKEIVDATNEGFEKGLNADEYAFYTALVKDPIILKEMTDEILIKLAQELTETVRKNRTIDWDKKESARAYMRKVVKRLLRIYDYPPKQADDAVAVVIKQAELMSANII